MKTLKDYEREFEEKYKDYIKDISIGQYDNNGVNVGFLKAKDVIKLHFTSKLTEAFNKGKEMR